MSSRQDDPLDPTPREKKDDGLLNGKECEHCGLWFRLDQAKVVKGADSLRCPFCDWMFEDGKG
ncbi:MAG: hypothetical protein HQL18_03875 [Candidatus Omnitrophica bacterium]|nr:hypothetical protein [Candidatus Omnitrophota bacterium]